MRVLVSPGLYSIVPSCPGAHGPVLRGESPGARDLLREVVTQLAPGGVLGCLMGCRGEETRARPPAHTQHQEVGGSCHWDSCPVRCLLPWALPAGPPSCVGRLLPRRGLPSSSGWRWSVLRYRAEFFRGRLSFEGSSFSCFNLDLYRPFPSECGSCGIGCPHASLTGSLWEAGDMVLAMCVSVS